MLSSLEKKSAALYVKDLGLIDYTQAYRIQKEAREDVIEGGVNTLLLCEHLPVFTLGRMDTGKNFMIPEQEIIARGVKIIPVDRGGEVTLHCPGQLVIYPIFNLLRFGKDLKSFLNKLEQVAIDLLRDFDILATGISGQRGVWVDRKKIVSIGIGVRKWVSFHGMSINVQPDLKLFSMIRPCGLDVQMTSIKALRGNEVPMQEVKSKVLKHFKNIFDLEISSPLESLAAKNS